MKFIKYISGPSPIVTSEASLLAKYRQSGELRILGDLYSPCMDYVFSICYKYLQDEDESKDAVMQIFEKLITDLRTHEVTNFRNWLHSVSRNYCLMQLRARRMVVGGEDLSEEKFLPQLTIEVEDTAETMLNEQNLTRLEACMKALNPEQRIAVDLFYLKEMCYRDIADQTGFDPGRVKSYIQNGKRSLKICMKKNGIR